MFRIRIIIACAIFFCLKGAIAQEQALSLTIDRAVEIALQQSLAVQTARLQVEAAEARVDAARADRLPQVDAALEHRRITSPPRVELPPDIPGIPPEGIITTPRESTVATISARQAVYTGNRIPSQISRAESLLDAAIASLGVTETQIALNVREAYYTILLSESLVVAAARTLEAATEQLDVATARFEVGTAPQFDVLRAETQVSEAEQNLLEARNRVQVSQIALLRIMGLPLDAELILETPELEDVPDENLPTLIETAQLQRGEILAVRSRIAAAEAGIRVAESQRRPELGVNANYQYVFDESPFETTGWTFLAVLGISIFDGGRIRANIRESEAVRDETLIALEDVTQAVEQEVRRIYLNLITDRQTIETARTRVAQAEEAYEIARVRYEAGIAVAVELADALAALSSALTNLDQAIFNYNVTFARLQASVGRIEY